MLVMAMLFFFANDPGPKLSAGKVSGFPGPSTSWCRAESVECRGDQGEKNGTKRGIVE